MVNQTLYTIPVNMKISLLKSQWIYIAKVNIMSALVPKTEMDKGKTLQLRSSINGKGLKVINP